MKKILKHKLTQHILGFIAALYIFFVKITSKVNITDLQMFYISLDFNIKIAVFVLMIT